MIKIHSSALLIFSFFLIAGCGKPDNSPVDVAATGTVTDVEGNVYKTIKIGDQWWMAENLKVKKYRDGKYISDLSADSAAWANDTFGAYCSYDPYNPNINRPGLLYNWYTINNPSGIAPAGWHIPTDGEWKQLERFIGMSPSQADEASWRGSPAGDKLKIGAKQGWKEYGEVWPTNESGFTALAGNCRLFNSQQGDPSDLQSTGFWWCASESMGTPHAWYRYLDYKNSGVFRSVADKKYGFSIRCVKD